MILLSYLGNNDNRNKSVRVFDSWFVEQSGEETGYREQFKGQDGECAGVSVEVTPRGRTECEENIVFLLLSWKTSKIY